MFKVELHANEASFSKTVLSIGISVIYAPHKYGVFGQVQGQIENGSKQAYWKRLSDSDLAQSICPYIE
jgi:hypothetical protein